MILDKEQVLENVLVAEVNLPELGVIAFVLPNRKAVTTKAARIVMYEAIKVCADRGEPIPEDEANDPAMQDQTTAYIKDRMMHFDQLEIKGDRYSLRSKYSTRCNHETKDLVIIGDK